MGLDNMDFALYLNIAFYSMLGIGILVGFLKGFRRSLYTFIITIIFIGVFFLTVNSIVGYLYTMELGFLGGILGNVSPDLNNVTSLKDAISILLAQQVEGSLDTTLSNPEFLAFVDSIGMFVLKIVYTILYFTVIQFIYRFILFIISLFIFRKGRSKNKKGNKTRWAGSIFGFMTAAVNVFVFIIVMSGIMSIAESLVSLQTTELNNTVEITEPNRESISDINNASNSLMIGEYQQLAETTDSELTQAIESLEQIIADYNNNLIIKLSNSVKVEDEITSEEQSLGIILFDEVLSIKYNDTNIALREDLRTFSEVASIYLNSDYYDSGDLADLSSTEINNIFTTLSQSNLLVSIIPIGVEVGADYFDVDVELDKETLYEDIIWRDEIQQIGAVASTGFMILESANAFDPDIDYKTVSLDGEDVEDLFDSLSESKLVEYGAYLAVEPLLEQASLEMQSVITIPEDIDWKDEFVAFGDIANEILSSGITIADLESGDVQQILTLFSDVDLTVLLNSKLTTRALVNILSGQSELELNIDFLVIPDMPYEDWVDQYDTLGELVSEGELRKILSSINILVDSVSDIDFDDLQINDLTNISSDDIDNIFESRVLVASVTEAIRGLSTDELSLIIPDSVLDEDNYIEKQEVKNLFNAITMAAGQLPCDADDTECEELGFDIDKILSLSETNINTLFDSEILFSTASNMIMEYGEDQLVIPEDTKITISVEEADLIIVNKTEIKNAFLAISVLGLSDLNNINVDASLLTNLAEADVDDPVTPEDETTTLDTTKSTKLFASKILHATISKFLLDETGENATVIVPILASEDYEDTTTDLVLIEDTVGGVDYISEEELTQILEAVLILQLSDFTDLDIAPEDLVANSDELLDSAILHATITDQLIKQIDDGAVTVPDTDVEGNSIFTTTAENDEYIIKDELSAIFNALDLLDITDFNSISLDSISLDTIIANDDALLDSAILHATISSEILKQRDAETLSVPNRDLDENLIIKTVSGTDFIVKSEIKNTLGALELLEIDDFTNVNVDISILNKLSVDPVTDPTTLSIDNANDLLKSKIVHMTITDLIIDAATPATVGEDAPIVVPYKAETNYNFTSTDYSYSSDMVRDYTTDDDEYIVEAEIIYLLKIILKLEITDLDSFGTDDPNDPLLAKILPHKDILFDSAIIQATITDQMINLESEDLIIPDKDYNEVDVILTREYIKSATETITDTYVSRVELEAALDALDKLEITDFSNIELDDMTFILDKIQNDNLLDSSILHATISEKIVAESETGNLVVPSRGTDEVVIKKDVMTVTYISEIEIIATLDALDVLGITDFTALNIDPSIIQNLGEYDAVDDRNELVPERATTLFASKIVHATISKMITDAAIPDEITGD
ncbi:MAG: hypothetical protein K9L64_02040, partial [Candidatus Izimaplasma sp.]|nr:hypothetical protein [Candidatus Izimaplasma bacterium]